MIIFFGYFLVALSILLSLFYPSFDNFFLPASHHNYFYWVEYAGNIKLLPVYLLIFILFGKLKGFQLWRPISLSILLSSTILLSKFSNSRKLGNPAEKLSLPNGSESLFPSGHTGVAIVLAFLIQYTLFQYNRKNKLLLLLPYAIPLFVSILLLVNRDHYLTDITASLGLFLIIKNTGPFKAPYN